MGTPYREAKPLAQLIAPDRRLKRSLALVGVGVVAGILLVELVELVGVASSPPRPETLAPPPPRIVPVAVAPPPPEPFPIGRPSKLTEGEIDSVIATHRANILRRCSGAAVGRENVDVLLAVYPSGLVRFANALGQNQELKSCVERDVRGWRFPAHAEESEIVNIPFVFDVNLPLVLDPVDPTDAIHKRGAPAIE